MAIRVKLLKQVLSLKKQGLSNQVCVQTLLETCKAADCADTIDAFYDDAERKLRYRIASVEAEYMGHLEVCGRYNRT